MRLINTLVASAIVVTASWPASARGCPQDDTGTVILHAIDIESGEPIADVSFAIENSLAEMWAVNAGKSDNSGRLQIKSNPQPGYFYSVFPLPQGYKVVGLDAVPTDIKPGVTTLHRFHLRKLDAKVDVPGLIPRNNAATRLLPAKSKDGSQVTRVMPGFEGQLVQFHFVNTEIAEYICRNGQRLRGAIDSELSLFQRAEGQKAGDIKKISGVKVVNVVSEGKVIGFTVWCRTDGAMELRQDGFKIFFNAEFDKWDLSVPDYLHPAF